MCLLAFAWKKHPRYKLILASNRDEFYKRRSASAAFWEDAPAVLAGKDLEAGGTWMGLNKELKQWTALTNFRDPQNIRPDAPSRGQLTSQYLLHNYSPHQYLEGVFPVIDQYNGFNLLVGNTETMMYVSNYENRLRVLAPGLYGLSNHLLDTPWYKVTALKQKLAQALTSENIDVASLFDILHDPMPASDAEVQQTGLKFELEKMLSAPFIISPDYGTCCSSVLLIDNDNQAIFAERWYNTATKTPETQVFSLDLA